MRKQSKVLLLVLVVLAARFAAASEACGCVSCPRLASKPCAAPKKKSCCDHEEPVQNQAPCDCTHFETPPLSIESPAIPGIDVVELPAIEHHDSIDPAPLVPEIPFMDTGPPAGRVPLYLANLTLRL